MAQRGRPRKYPKEDEGKTIRQKKLEEHKKVREEVQGTGFFSQENIKEYQHEMVTHSFGKDAPKKIGRGSFFESVEECEQWIMDFFDLCSRTEVLPTISGLACWLNNFKTCSKSKFTILRNLFKGNRYLPRKY